ncbi:hypothetical protein GGTG_01378 [Gaeumannomyces tritici R3-111a-1]|uniref:Uncharacterized protein n=1 Tax=Gaeumannomyces tritici (strain R3-111a-1) TaxID=644352 RepID=J3NJE6_GAET3|nr:hypothetical protein GGTG_01378 [Gaeumannomyces tritici R3-111a-1]EJT81397.1 hypothetical protein GGTG_01378 [Gaeumannomyces tritici R3-111a-1]
MELRSRGRPGRPPPLVRRRRRRRQRSGARVTERRSGPPPPPPAAAAASHGGLHDHGPRARGAARLPRVPARGAAALPAVVRRGLAPGRVLFDPERDLPFLGARDGYMASDGQLRTVLSLTPPAELRLIRRLALSEALLWVDAAAAAASATAAATIPGVVVAAAPGSRRDPPLGHAACSARELLGLVRARLPACRELVFVPHDGNPVIIPAAPATPVLEPAAAATAAPRRRLLEAQLRAALDDVRAAFPTWDPPRISVMSLPAAAAASAPAGRGCGEEEEEEEERNGRRRKRRKTHHRHHHHHHECVVPRTRHHPSQPLQQLPAGCGHARLSRIDMIHRSAVSKFLELREAAAFLRMTQEAC